MRNAILGNDLNWALNNPALDYSRNPQERNCNYLKILPILKVYKKLFFAEVVTYPCSFTLAPTHPPPPPSAKVAAFASLMYQQISLTQLNLNN